MNIDTNTPQDRVEEVYSEITDDKYKPFYIHNKTGNVYYVESVKLDCTNSRGGHEARRMMVAYGPVHQEFATRVLEKNTLYRQAGKLRQHIFGKPENYSAIPVPYIRDLDEFLQNFTQMSESVVG